MEQFPSKKDWFTWFPKFLNWAERQALADRRKEVLFASLSEYWQDWYDDEARDDKEEINGYNGNIWAHRAFISILRDWVEKTCPDHSQAATWLLLTLARKEPFDQWKGFDDYRNPSGLGGALGVYLHRAKGGMKEDVQITNCILVPKLNPESTQPMHYTDKHLLLDEQAKDTPHHALEAVKSLLTGTAFWWPFLLWALFGEKELWKRARWRRLDWALTWLGWPLCASLFGFLLFADPWKYFATDTILVMGAGGFVALSVLMMGARLLPILLEWWRIKRQRQVWANFLSRSCACPVIGKGEELKVIGPSFGLAFFFSILAALERDLPAQSRLTRQLMDCLANNAASLVFTGEIRDGGRIHQVARLKDKIEAVLAGRFFKHFIVPAQKVIRGGGETFQRMLPLASGEVYAAGESLLHVQPYSDVMPLMQDLGAFRKRAPFRMMVTTMALWGCLATLVGFTVRDLRQLAPVSPSPTLLLKGAPIVNKTLSLKLQIWSSAPARFAARLNSDYWAHRSEETFLPKQQVPGLGEIMIETEKSREAKGPEDDAQIELIYPRRFLGRNLPPTIIEASSLYKLRN